MAKKKLNTYRLHFVMKEYYYVDVEATNLDEAMEQAEEIESSQLKSIEDILVEYEFDREFTINTNSDQGINNGKRL